MADDLELSAFEKELIRRLRALSFEQRQRISRAILRLQREQGVVPTDDREKPGPGQSSGPLWNMAPDEIAELRRSLAEAEEAPPDEDE
ncbi:MAG: hypothetical protein KBI47_05320 [Armatimonadetes bacterium]|nr:hypothetical protein [Armatimonadota bacterium]MDI9584903.1 hypothetical protein [Acidobacteriota bacterium]